MTYNHTLYIEEAIDSILSQKFNVEREIILLDDASTDGTFEKAVQKLSKEINCRCIKNEANLGITRNYQKGFSLCRGEFVFVLEGDDYWTDNEKISKQVSFLEKRPLYALCFHDYMIREGSSNSFRKYISNTSDEGNTFSIKHLIADSGLIGNFSVCCYRKTFLDKLPSALYEHISYDWIINMFMGHFGCIGKIHEYMSVYRHVENATWSGKSHEKQILEMLTLIPIYNSLLEFKYDALFKELEMQLAGQLALKKQRGKFSFFGSIKKIIADSSKKKKYI